jgi:plastocyanin
MPTTLARLALLVGFAAASPPASPDARADVRLFRFEPRALEVRAGTRVVWLNRDETAHTVTAGAPDSAGAPAPRPEFDAPLAARGDSAAVVFDRPGEHPYHCARHPFMRGTVRVVP